MFIRLVNVKGSGKTYRYAQLVESFRRSPDSRPTHRVLANLGQLSDEEVGVLRSAFSQLGDKAASVVPKAAAGVLLPGFSIQQNLQYLDVAVCYEAWRRSGVGRVLDALAPRGASEMALSEVTAILTSHRCVAPGSKLAAERWMPDTAWPELLGVQAGRFRNTRIHRALDALDRNTEELQRRLPELYLAQKPHFAALFLDVTDTWFVGRGPPAAEKAFTKEGFYAPAISIVLLCNEDGYPLRWDVISARRGDAPLMESMLEKVSELDWARQVPVVMDRSMGKTATLQKVAATGLRFVTALTTQEFDTYTEGRIPSQAVAALDACAPNAVVRAAHAVKDAGMHRVSDTLYVRDLGLVQQTVDDDSSSRRSLDKANPAGDALRLAQTARAKVAAGDAPDFKTAARALELTGQRMSEYLRLLDLAPDLQEEVLAGHARMSLRTLKEIAGQPDAEQQRRAYAEEQLKRHLLSRGPSKTASTTRPPLQPLRLRVVVCFNPSRFVDARLAADETLAKVRTFEREENERLRSPHARRTKETVYSQADQELRRRSLLDTFDILIAEENGHPTRLELRLNPKAWQQRRRFDGFHVIVAHPDSLGDAGQLASLYREKNCVEQDFRHIKSEVELRPVRHHTDAKVRAHVTLCMLALLVDRLLERTLREIGRPMTAAVLYEQLRGVHLNRCFAKGADQPVYLLTAPSPDCEALVQALNLSHLTDSQTVAATIKSR